MRRALLGRALREPMVHFVVLGTLLFGVAALRAGPAERASAGRRIVVTSAEVRHLVDGFTRTWQRAPTASELAGLVDELVRDEVYYREGVALGLERDDAVVRRRLRQKMEFLVEDAAAGPPPSEAELQAYLDAHPDAFRREPTLSFRQVYLDADRRGTHAADDAGALAARLARSGPDAEVTELGDPIMLPADVEAMGESEIATTFGADFARALATLPLSEWRGPIESGYGLHVVVVRTRTPGRLATLSEVREAVLREATAATRKQRLDDAYGRLRTRYEVVVEPSPSNAAVAAR